MKRFLSCDWGTSSFRLRVVETLPLTIIAEQKSEQGIIATYELWKQSGKPKENRMAFYLAVIRQHVKLLKNKTNIFLDELPLIISGMASSSIGIMELPYKEFPFSADGSDLTIDVIESIRDFPKVIIISGGKTIDDAVRGEETQLAGCFQDDDGEQIFIFPGTHSKHIIVKQSKAIKVKTYMTGEFFELLSKKSILSDSVEEGTGLQDAENRKAFEKGVNDIHLNLLHSSFLVRTNHLFNKFTKKENYYYLSGLLIGTEIKELINQEYARITLVSSARLTPYYETAVNILNKDKSILEIKDADEAVVRGQYKILIQLVKNN
ncbi:MAG TPA: 2-dehydro-3-deoxygalactonokinase [Chitinophagaceae bacterium]|jgi:2-dehydro-3-deoxygalactonokinase|nr:2-dehydro-3-deoxygalactonokinase [Chitinophagaceae bacterium]